MAVYFAKSALLPQGWADNVLITVDDSGMITDIQSGQTGAVAQILDGPVLPGMPNLHSHAFQYAMAGLAERASGDQNSFWTWRKTMYDFLATFGPEELGDIATRLYRQMLKSGYTQVGEFHYLHHRPDGTPYDDRSLLARCMIRAAKKAGIGITILPVLYAQGGFGGKPPEDGQKRFINTPDQILSIVSSLRQEYKNDPQVTVGLAFHSLRAVTPEMIRDVTKAARRIDPDMPIHIHVAEQEKEIDDCKEWSGKRPVEWLLDNADIDSHWCFVHATHMTEDETRAMARSGAVAGLCPTTEANLGDGIFNLPTWIQAGGKFGIGSDSHISVNMIEELRTLEYGQRLLRKSRVIARTENEPHAGAFLYKAALEGGAQALGAKTGQISLGCRADFIVLDAQEFPLKDRAGDMILDAAVFATNKSPVRDVYVGGRSVVKNFGLPNDPAGMDYGDIPPGILSRLLREAAARDDVEAVASLLGSGANPYDMDDKGRTAFNRSASSGLRALALMTEEAFRDTQNPKDRRRWKDYGLNAPSGYYSSTLITYAAKVCTAAVVDEMIAAGADITIVNGSGWNLLHCASVMPGRADVLKTLIRAFHAQGLHSMIGGLSTHVYETDYGSGKIVYREGLTAADLCRARMAQDPGCPKDLAGYIPLL